MINSRQLLADLQKLLKGLEKDIRERLESQTALDAQLKAEWQSARDAKRTATTYFDWRDEAITQAGAHWILACVFLRFLEDNGYLERPFLFGSDAGTQALARDRRETYFRANPSLSDREYLIACFDEAAKLPGLAGLYDARHNPLFRLGVSGDGAMSLLGFWQRIDPDSGRIVHNFEDPSHATRFLGDLYQDLSESARKRYALLQTPVFVEEFILDRTLTPAIQEFGYREVRLIDPTCGSGHFLLGTFARLFDLWTRNEPARNLPDLVQRALDAVYGVDLNPFAVEIARFRLLIAALNACQIESLKAAPDFKIHLAVGDSLLHGRRFGQLDLNREAENLARRGHGHAYATEDVNEVNRILGQQYHAVVGNPPYITPKDAALNEVYRSRYSSCHMKYSLGVPFTERFFELALPGSRENGLSEGAGFVGMITANSFMKREFGRKLIESFLPTVDLTHIVDTAGAYIPGHGTPTVILLGRHRRPVSNVVRTAMGTKGEPSTPADPAQGFAWQAIMRQLDQPGSRSQFVSVADIPRGKLARHPWSIGGGGAAELKELLEDSRRTLDAIADEVGIVSVTGEDDLFVIGMRSTSRRLKIEHVRPLINGDLVRDWTARSVWAVWLYDDKFNLLAIEDLPNTLRFFWPFRSNISKRKRFGTPMLDRGLTWYEWQELYVSKLHAPLSLTFAEVASHNHFVLDRGGKVFKQTAPVIKLPADATEEMYLALLGLLNSSIACFWMKQVSHQKQMTGGDGVRVASRAKVPYQFAGTQLRTLPLPEALYQGPLRDRLTRLAEEADRLGNAFGRLTGSSAIAQGLSTATSVREVWDAFQVEQRQIRARLILLQEEMDFTCYCMYGLAKTNVLLDEPLRWQVDLQPGDRSFCIHLQQNQDGFVVPREIPCDWPSELQEVWSKRIEVISSSPELRIIEDANYKRRWIGRQGVFNRSANVDEFLLALECWLLDRLEAERYWPASGAPQLRSVNQIADVVRTDTEFMHVAALYSGRDDFNVARLVGQLVESEAVPFLPALRYVTEGLRKRAEWESTWTLQRQEDAIDARIVAETPRNDGESEHDYGKRLESAQRGARKAELGDIPVPPKYKSSDLLSQTFWRLRGALDVSKERFVSYPLASRDADGSLVVAWAGWDHLQQATALAAHYLDLKDQEGWAPERLAPLLAGLLELVPWLKQWHNDYDAEHGTRMGDYFDGFVQDEARELGLNGDGLRAWRPPLTTRRRQPRAGR